MNRIDFLQGFLRSPLEVGSVIPSSRFMIRKIMSHIEDVQPRSVVELGAGTGVITRELSKYCSDQNIPLIVFEKDDKMRAELQQQFPNISIHSDAFDLPQIIVDLKMDHVDCIISGLPFFYFPENKKDELLEKIYAQLPSNGSFIKYQYTTELKKRIMHTFDEVSMNYVLLNIPPTFLYFCKKK